MELSGTLEPLPTLPGYGGSGRITSTHVEQSYESCRRREMTRNMSGRCVVLAVSGLTGNLGGWAE